MGVGDPARDVDGRDRSTRAWIRATVSVFLVGLDAAIVDSQRSVRRRACPTPRCRARTTFRDASVRARVARGARRVDNGAIQSRGEAPLRGAWLSNGERVHRILDPPVMAGSGEEGSGPLLRPFQKARFESHISVSSLSRDAD